MSKLQHLASFVSRREGDENFDPTAQQSSGEHNPPEGDPRKQDSGTRPAPLESKEDQVRDLPLREHRMEYEWRKSKSDSRDQSVKDSFDLRWSRIRAALQEPFSEFLGVLVFTMVQQGGIAQATLSVGDATAPGGNGYGQYLTVPFW